MTDDTIKNIFHDAENLNIFLQNMLKISDENIELAGKIETLEPKAEYFDQMMNSELLTNFRTTAKEMGIKPMCFIGFLLDEKYLFRNTKNVLLPYQKFVNSGLFELVEFVRNNHKGVQTLVTPKGRAYFLKEYFS